MFETLKEEMRNFLKEMEEKTNRKMEDISKSLKENQEKAFKHMKETSQDLKTEIGTIKKTQAEGMIETEITKKMIRNHKFKHEQKNTRDRRESQTLKIQWRK